MTVKLVQHSRKTESTRQLPCKLTQDEFNARAKELGDLHSELNALEARHEGLKTTMKAEAAEVEAKRSRLSVVVSHREEYREVRVTTTYDYDAGKVVAARDDTGEILEERNMRTDERQVEAPL